MNAANRWKFIALFLGVCCATLIYREFDQGITTTYLVASEDSLARLLKVMTNLIAHEWKGMPEDQVMLRLKLYVDSQPPGSIVLKSDREANAIYLDVIQFDFQDGKLAGVK
jgi:hypothetical protein